MSPGVRARFPHSFLREQHHTRAADDTVHKTETSTRKFTAETQLPTSQRLSAFLEMLSDASAYGITGTSQMPAAAQKMSTGMKSTPTNLQP